MAGKPSLAVISHADCAFLPRSHGFLRIFWHRTPATGYGLVYNKRRIADIGERKRTLLHGSALGKLAQIVCQLIKLDFRLLLRITNRRGARCPASILPIASL